MEYHTINTAKTQSTESLATESPGSDNVDPSEINKFSELASRWWDPNSEFKPLHDINPLRLGYVERRQSLAGLTVLDVGCGGGILSESMAQKGAHVTGIDLSEPALTVAKLHALESGTDIKYQLISAENHADEAAGSYDIVTCLEMLEHVPSPAQTIEACAKLAKPGGTLFFSTLNRNPKSWVFAILGAEYILKLLPAGTHEYNRFIKPSELAGWCRTAKLDVTDLTGMTYNPFAKTYKLGKDVSVNYLMEVKKND